MLRITASKNALGAIRYFEQGLSKEDYYIKGNDVAGQWHGKAAIRLGITGEVSKEDFTKLIQNRTPQGDKLTPRDRANRRPGYDFTFNAPKSTSLVYAITKDDAILKAHQRAVLTAMNAVEENVQTQKGQGKKKHYATTGNMVMASFDHFSARPVKKIVDGREVVLPDPHLHTHCFVMNATWNEEKERFQAIELSTVKKEAPYYESLYHMAFIDELKKAGYGIERDGKKWEIKGIDRKTVEKFSNRTIEINETAEKKKLTWAKDKAEVGAKTRLKKNDNVTQEELNSAWVERLSDAELEVITKAKSSTVKKGETDGRSSPTPPNIKGAHRALDKALAHFFERKSVMSEKRILGHALASSYGELERRDIEAAWQKRNDIIRVNKNGANLVTTKQMLREEDRLIGFASSTKGRVAPLHPEYAIKRDFLNEQQRNAVKHILSSSDQVTIVAGGAGTGKTSLLQEVREAHAEKERKLFAFAPSADASRGVLQDKGFEGATTLAELMSPTYKHEDLKDQTLLVDEAGMVSLKDMNRVFDIAKAQNARVILSGDWKQHHAVQAGDALRLLDERAGLPVARVNEVVRQRHNKAYKAAIKDLSEGRVKQGFDKLDRMGAVREIEDRNERHQAIADDYVQSLQSKRSAIVVSPTHKEGREITQAIRSKLKKSGRLGQDDKIFQTQRPLHWTDAERQDPKKYEVGFKVQFHQNAPGIKAGKKYEVRELTEDGRVMIGVEGNDATVELPLNTYERFQTFRQNETKLAKGDLIRITKNGRAVDGSRLNNGQVFTVNDIDKKGNLILPGGKTLSKDYRNFTLGYSRTSYASQGKDAQDVFLAQSSQSFAASNDKQFYVSASRGEQRCFIYTDDKQELRDVVAQSADRISAKELVETSEHDLNKNQYFKHGKGIKQKSRERRSPQIKMAQPEKRTPGQ